MDPIFFQTSLAATSTTRAPADDQFWQLFDVENYVICMKFGTNRVQNSPLGSCSTRPGGYFCGYLRAQWKTILRPNIPFQDS